MTKEQQLQILEKQIKDLHRRIQPTLRDIERLRGEWEAILLTIPNPAIAMVEGTPPHEN